MKLILENWRLFIESHTKEQEEELKIIVGELEKASEMHAGQAKRIQQILDETDDDKLEEGDNFFDNMRAKQKECEGKPKTGKCAEDRPKPKEWAEITAENQEVDLYEMVKEELEAVLAEKKKKKKPCKPSKGKRFAKRVNGKCRSFGQSGQAKGGGDRIRPGTKKGDAYCARSAKIKKCKNPPCANDLSRKKWKCRGSKSMKE
tara:strand:- start:642 stop:1250 length:609 start_codon:yes stop_codon:yes gene_type:complete